jgi:hypothetical protein
MKINKTRSTLSLKKVTLKNLNQNRLRFIQGGASENINCGGTNSVSGQQQQCTTQSVKATKATC